MSVAPRPTVRDPARRTGEAIVLLTTVLGPSGVCAESQLPSS